MHMKRKVEDFIHAGVAVVILHSTYVLRMGHGVLMVATQCCRVEAAVVAEARTFSTELLPHFSSYALECCNCSSSYSTVLLSSTV
jgi:hypothetical protein